ncbi:unnamed protein product [Cochlearia groenlandica]
MVVERIGDGEPETIDFSEPRYSDDLCSVSACSTPFVSAPSSPGRGLPPPPSGYFFSAPSSPMHSFLFSADPSSNPKPDSSSSSTGDFEFDFSYRLCSSSSAPIAGKPTNGIAKRRGGLKPSAHELHYTKNRAQAEEMKKRTYLPYRNGLFGCLGFSSKGYSALNGLARSLNPVSSG